MIPAILFAMPAPQKPRRSQPRRSQEERSAYTRGRILDAALECLVERGYAGTTTTAVAERAGVSRGAQLHHFRTRKELLAGAVQHLYAGLRESFQKGFAQLSPTADRVHAALELLWDIFCDPRLTAVLELQVAARTDPGLAAALVPIGEAHDEHIHRLADEAFPGSAGPGFTAALDLVLDTMGGLRVRALLHPDDPSIPRTLDLLERVARDALGAGHGEPS